MAGTIVIDTGYLFGLFDSRDDHYSQANEKAHFIEITRVLLPWPVLYETINTRFVRSGFMIGFERLLTRSNVHLIDDFSYREAAYETVFKRDNRRNLSLCDVLIRLLIDDINLQVSGLLTFNAKDFHDICRERKVTIL
jgi:predicted nucleic acid-binding protein